jgi:hypothetical protein
MREELTNAKGAGNSQVLAQWCKGIRIFQVAHLLAAAHYQRLHRLLGVPVTVLTAAVSTSIFATMGEGDSKSEGVLLMAAGIISALTAILSGVNTFLNYAELAAKHQAAGNKYGKLRRRVDEIMALGYTEGIYRGQT